MIEKPVTIELPDMLPYPQLVPLSQCNELRQKFVYVFKHYPIMGITMMILRQQKTVMIRFADFTGTIIEADKMSSHPLKVYLEQISKDSGRLILSMKYIGIPKALFYFSADNGMARLVDMRLSINKFCGPGYLADFFGRQGLAVQEQVGKPLILDDDNIAMLSEAKGDYKHGKFIVKPSSFKTIVRNDAMIPMYGIVGVTDHEAKPTT